MKKILFVCLLMVFSISFVFAQTAANKTDATGKKQGIWEVKTPAGLSKGTYANDQKDGCWTTYTNDGKLIRIEHFSNGSLNGIAVDIDPRGYLAGETYYVNNLIEGTAKKFYYGANPVSIIDYLHGKINGKKKIYYENSAGKIQEESEYKDDLKNGASNYYTIKGDLIAAYLYVNNMLQGVQKTYYPGNKIMSEQEYVDNIENGFYKEYYENGNLKTEGTYAKGLMSGTWKDYDENGHLQFQGNCVNGEKEGKWLEYDASGKVIKTSTFVKGQLK
ncbi:MAG: toxin-antitoxin system YwqK family antitoxin [Lentimicrobiaceae bacterium]|jgi:antitoxin component YwqK of YwqJK toxin-antitoxin module